MLLRRLGLGSPILFAVLGVCLLGQARNSLAQIPTPSGWIDAANCAECHTAEYLDWAEHGHAWMQIHTNGSTPNADLFAPVGQALPILPMATNWPTTGQTTQITWADVVDIFGHFRDGEGDLLLTNGRYIAAGATGTVGNQMPGRCNKCHNTGGDANVNGQYGNPLILGTWKLNGIQCDQCHRKVNGSNVDHMAIPDIQVCRDCHSSGIDTGKYVTGNDPNNPDAAKFGFRIASSNGINFTGHHGEGDEYRRSPHQDIGCAACHDPHKSVWHDKGGVRFAEEQGGEGNMCKQCHIDIRIRGSMGEMGMECIDCHMPETSAFVVADNVGHRRTHIFKINSAAVRADNGQPNTEPNNWLAQKNDSNANGRYWMNYDGTTGAGETFITLDMVCKECHENMSLDQMSSYAKYIHREPGLVDVTANGVDKLLVAKPTTTVGVQYTVYPDERVGMSSEMWVLSQGPKGWTYWNGSAWKRGMKAWKTAPLKEETVKLPKVRLAKGGYSYWVEAFPADGSEEVDTVSVYVSKK